MKALRRVFSLLRHLALYALLRSIYPRFPGADQRLQEQAGDYLNPFGLPPSWSLDNFITAFQRMGFVSAFMNS